MHGIAFHTVDFVSRHGEVLSGAGTAGGADTSASSGGTDFRSVLLRDHDPHRIARRGVSGPVGGRETTCQEYRSAFRSAGGQRHGAPVGLSIRKRFLRSSRAWNAPLRARLPGGKNRRFVEG